VRILFEGENPAISRRTTLTIDPDTGLPLIMQWQDTRPIVESAKRIAASFDPHRHPRQDIQHVARIPLVMWQRLARVGITRDEVAFTAWLNSREARALRCDDGRKL